MEQLTQPTVVEAEAHRSEIAERISHASTQRVPATAHRHLLAQRLRRFADRIDS
jgi:hypothetical protein